MFRPLGVDRGWGASGRPSIPTDERECAKQVKLNGSVYKTASLYRQAILMGYKKKNRSER